MSMTKALRNLAAAMLLAAWLGTAAWADGGRESAGINSRDGNASPVANSIWGHSNLDDYTQQDEQINIDGGEDSVVKVLRVNQKILVNDYVVRVLPIRNASPIEIRNAFREVTRAEGGRAEVIRDKKKKEYFLYVVAPKFQMPFIEDALAALDEPWVMDDVDGSCDDYYRAKFRDIRNVNDMAIVPASASVGAAVDNLVEFDDTANAAWISGEPYRVESYVKYAKEVDQPVPQIQLEATVYEVEVSNEKRLGLDYIAWKNGPGRNLFEFIFWGADYKQTFDEASSIFDPFVPDRTVIAGTTTLDGNARGWWMGANYMVTAAYLDFLEGSGRARVVSKGKVLVKNNESGSLSATDQVLHFTVAPTPSTFGITPPVTVEGGGELPVHSRTVDKTSSINIGFSLNVTPCIGQETTELDIVMSVADIVGLTPGGTPLVRNHGLSTTVLIRDGQQFCVGGLRRTEDVKQTQKMPFLGDLPVLGWLFGHEATVDRETEMVVVLTPKIRFGTEADLEMASDDDKLVRAQVEKLADLTVPATVWGFDQWLMGDR